jgi:DNA repair exonuclease SbcCD ATPase subunit
MKTFVTIALVVSGGLLGYEIAGDEERLSNDASADSAGLEARMYLRHARDRVETIYTRLELKLPTPPKEMQEFVSEIVRDVKAGDTSMDALRGRYSKDTNVIERINRLKDQNKEIQLSSARLAAAFAKEPLDIATATDASSESWRQLDAAEIETSNLLKSLNIVRRVPTKAKSASDAPADAAATFGKGFRPHTAHVYQRSILDNARVLDHYAGTKGALPDATIAEHLGEIERQLAALKKEYAKLDAEFRKEKGLEADLKAVEESQAKLGGQVDLIKKNSATRKLNPTELKESSNLIRRSAISIMNQSYRVMDRLGTQPVQHEEPLYAP